jgi:hypothetical protein
METPLPFPGLFFCPLMLLGALPVPVVLGITIGAAALAVLALWRRPLFLPPILAFLLFQSGILLLWLAGATAGAYFNTWPPPSDATVLDPDIENDLMGGFAIAAPIAAVVAIVSAIWPGRKAAGEGHRTVPRRWLRVLVTVAIGFSSLATWANLNNYRRMSGTGGVPTSVSPDGSREVRLVPMNCWIDVNGVVLARRPGEWWYKPLGCVGDELSQSGGGQFEWLADSTGVQLWLEVHWSNAPPEQWCVLAYDFRAGRQMEPAASRPASRATTGSAAR